ncbi:MAG: SDR family oxidoreductase [Deltaproteobacteria bacterium]|nr:SDR family oxidoreductase [Deltaproteobacteria bacterium]MBW2360990.1 SDR family oxidoreductase [Deltaproteobacteria bacterium]
MRFQNKSVIVTGAAQGMGRAYADAFAAEGARVALFDRNAEGVEAAAKGIRQAGGSVFGVGVDITDEAGIVSAVARVEEEHGGVDVLVNNAGLHLGDYNECIALDFEKWREIFEVNVLGQLGCVRACRPSLARSQGVVVNQSSNSAYLGVGAYSITKLALNGLTTSLARELGPEGIRVVGIAPGLVDTEATTARLAKEIHATVLSNQIIPRKGKYSEMVGTVMFLASDDAGFITGQTVTADGGWIQRL